MSVPPIDAAVERCDVRDDTQVSNLFNRLATPPNVVVACAGNVVGAGHPLNLTADHLRAEWETNTPSFYLTAKPPAHAMLPLDEGHIIEVTPIRGLPHSGRAPLLGYSAAKVCVMLADSTSLTGQNIIVDGGFSLKYR